MIYKVIVRIFDVYYNFFASKFVIKVWFINYYKDINVLDDSPILLLLVLRLFLVYLLRLQTHLMFLASSYYCKNIKNIRY